MEANTLEKLLGSMTRAGGSSLHLIPGQSPCMRVQGKFVSSENSAVESAEIEELTRDLLFEDHREQLSSDGQVHVLYVTRSGQRFRTTVLRQELGLSLLMRPVPETPPKLEELHLPAQFGSFLHLTKGLVLVSGFFGSGKSTTLAALVDRFNENTSRHLVTIENPIECMHPPGQAMLHQREVGPHVADAATGIRQAMRMGADVIFVNDLADGEALHAVLDACEAGALVFAGFEASSVVGACTDLPLLVESEERASIRRRMAAVLRAVTTQTLLPAAHKQGRVPMVEILIANAAVQDAIVKGAFLSLPSIMNRCRGLGMQSADMALRGLLASHLISPDEAAQHATNREVVFARGIMTSMPATGVDVF
jgi:twitching motility protein PilT